MSHDDLKKNGPLLRKNAQPTSQDTFYHVQITRTRAVIYFVRMDFLAAAIQNGGAWNLQFFPIRFYFGSHLSETLVQFIWIRKLKVCGSMLAPPSWLQVINIAARIAVMNMQRRWFFHLDGLKEISNSGHAIAPHVAFLITSSIGGHVLPLQPRRCHFLIKL